MSRKKKVKKGLHPGIAVGLLVLGGGFAAKSMLGTLAPAKPSGPEATFSTEIPTEVGVADATGTRWQDLLLVHGSHDKKATVQLAFHLPVEAVPAPLPATPNMETAPAPAGEWEGDEPPQLKLGVVMVSAATRRASLGGRIVGLGDDLGEAKVRRIERGFVQLLWRGRQLTYALDGDVPLEFRAEKVRREASKQAARAAANEAPADEPAPKEATNEEPTRAAATPAGSEPVETKNQKPRKQE